MSTTTTSGRLASAISKPRGPSSATSTWCPHTSSSARSALRASGLSSITSTRRGGAGGTETRSAGPAATAAGAISGSDTTNSLPRPTPSLVADTRPPCSSTRRCTSVSPSPRPPRERASGASARMNSSKTWRNISGAMPIPVSRTRITPSPPSRATVISTRPPAGVYLSALSSRLNTICSRRVPSPNTSTGSAWTESETSCSCMRVSPRRARSDWRAISFRSMRRASSSIRPESTRETSSRSSTRCARWRIWRSMMARWRAGSSGEAPA